MTLPYRIFLLFTFFQSLFWLGSCQTPDAQVPSHFIWEARRGTQLVTLVGTMHIGTKTKDLPPLLWQRLGRADKVLIETDLETQRPDLVRRFWQLPPDSPDLAAQLGPADWKKFTEIMQRAFPEISEAQLKAMSPAAACSQIMLAEAVLSADDAPPEVAMDVTICLRAKEQGKVCGQLEELEEQLHYLAEVFTLNQLREMLSEPSKDDYAKLQAAYREGRADLIEEMIKEMPENMRTVLLDQRNELWIKKLDGLLSPTHTLLAVGAAHFGGPHSLLILLKKKGFTVRPLVEDSDGKAL